MVSFKSLRVSYSAFYEAARGAHAHTPHPHRGHGFDHDVTVAALALKIAPDERTATKAWCAALIHSADHLVRQTTRQKGRSFDRKVEVVVRTHLALLPSRVFTKAEIEEICQAVLRHSELNQDDQSLTQQVLQDADRLANIMPSAVMRSGQMMPDVPPLEFPYLSGKPNPKSRYRGNRSVLDNLRAGPVAYLPQFRLPKAKRLGATYARQLRDYIRLVERGNRELGLAGIVL